MRELKLSSGLNKAAAQNPEVNQDAVVLMAPLFPSDNSDWSRSDLATFKGWCTISFDEFRRALFLPKVGGGTLARRVSILPHRTCLHLMC